jgi:hypothetical protein
MKLVAVPAVCSCQFCVPPTPIVMLSLGLGLTGLVGLRRRR